MWQINDRKTKFSFLHDHKFFTLSLLLISPSMLKARRRKERIKNIIIFDHSREPHPHQLEKLSFNQIQMDFWFFSHWQICELIIDNLVTWDIKQGWSQWIVVSGYWGFFSQSLLLSVVCGEATQIHRVSAVEMWMKNLHIEDFNSWFFLTNKHDVDVDLTMLRFFQHVEQLYFCSIKMSNFISLGLNLKS
jgi:hypothetical protein